jgi:hypothetical protein
MKYSGLHLFVLAGALSFLGGCRKQGRFECANLSRIEKNFDSRQTIDDVTVSIKQLTSKDRAYVFGEKNLAFCPVLMTIENRSKEAFLLDIEKQRLQVVEVEFGYRKSGADDSGSAYKIMAGGAGLYMASFASGTVFAMGNASRNLLNGVMAVGFTGLGLIFYGVGRLIANTSKCQRVRHIIFSNKPNYRIEKNNRLSVLLVFEKNNVPTLVPITLESQSNFQKKVLFRLGTNAAPKTNEFIYRTV